MAPNGDIANRPMADKAFEWAWTAMHQKNWRDAAERWAILRQVYPDHNLPWIQASIAHRALKEYEQSGALLEKAAKCFPKDPDVLIQQSELAIAQQNWVSAQHILAELQEQFPNEIAGWVLIGTVYAAQGYNDQAQLANQLARDKFSDRSSPWIQYAELAMGEGDWNQALERWKLVRKKFPDNAAGYMKAAEAAMQLGDERLARKLKLAREYGSAWLEKTEKEEQEQQLHISPPQRRNWLSFCDLVWTKARFNLKSEASQNHLRYLWWVIDPLLYMSVFYVVFGLLMHRGGPGFIAYLLTGLVPFQWFAKTVQQTSNSIVNGKGLMHKVRISPLFFPLVGVVQNTGKQLLVFGMLGLFLVLYGLPPTVHWLAFIPIVLVQLMLMVVVSCALAMMVPFVRDLTNLIPTGIQFLLFTSGIFYTIDRIPEEWRSLFFINPMANILYQYRQIFVENQWPDWSALGWVAFGCAIGLGSVIILYRRLESIFPRVVIE
ncbi:ABC transporter permease [Salinicola salarius]|uniref:ABC transporter permease n=1 Tax=Salinicola salarius TaxID=430457 RepID=UPI0023E471CD|nr:ABC transporter permease [Salinicola salarius]MDF3918797.1 ABC transporter permease [Salinicola salarius]